MAEDGAAATEPFIGRKDDLAFLESLHAQDRFAACAITGRRRIGKTTLLEEFCRGKRHLFFRFRRGSIGGNLIHMSRTMAAFEGREPTPYGSLEEALDAVKAFCREGKTVVVFDEFPFISSIDEGVSSDFQHFVDTMRTTDSTVIFCGSSVSGMQREFDSGSSPLYGRITARRTIGPLAYTECREFHPDMEETDSVRLYLTVGGVPLYHMMVRESTYRECIARHFLGNGADLADEAENIVTCELSPKDRHLSVVEAVAEGCRTVGEVSARTGLPKSTCSRYLGTLELIGIVDRVNPMAMRSSTEPPYEIADSMVAFGYGVLNKYPELRSYGDPLGSYDALYPEIATFLGKRFERMCSEYIRKSYITLDIGRWWGYAEGEHTDIDVVADVSDGKNRFRLYCECKFRRKEANYRDYEELRSTVDGIGAKGNRSANIRYVIFSASGFSDSMLEAEEDDPMLILIDIDTMIGRKPAKML